jgi:sucrose synthase
MSKNFLRVVEEKRKEFFGFMHFLKNADADSMVRGDMISAFKEHNERTEIENVEDLEEVVAHLQEAFFPGESVILDVRERVAYSDFFRVDLENAVVETLSPREYLEEKEIAVRPDARNNVLNLNFKPFYDHSPKVRSIKNIGAGVEYLNRFLSSQMINDTEKWKGLLFNFIKLHKHEGEQFILNKRVRDVDDLNNKIDVAVEKLREYPDDEPLETFDLELQDLGFEKGLGANAGDVGESLRILDNLLNAPDHLALMDFMSRVPMIFNIAIVSPHGFFAQENALGLPDTGGQVVYILDQVKALERKMIETLRQAGIKKLPKIVILTRLIPNPGETTCDQRLEKVRGTKNTFILRVPFRSHNPEVTNNWISRFEIWPYLEEFAEDAAVQLQAEFGGKPDFIIGNYSDGNLVAHLLSKRFGVTMACIAHALEKSKYLFSGLYWDKMEERYNFSMQFTSDLMAFNSADFLITSSYQEIAGTERAIGQYETYTHFTMPGLYRVENGVDPRHTKFNIVSPGVNEDVYFPHTESDRRICEVTNSLKELLFENKADPDAIGELADPEKTPIFTMARLDKIKNITSLVKWFGETPELQEVANLVVVAGKINPEDSDDREEREEIQKMHDLVSRYNLGDKMRWVGKLFRKDEAGEVYRLVADKRGVFVQPGLFEGFGLTVLEAMISGVPVFVTRYGGPLEIVVNNVSGFHIDPVDEEESAQKILDFVRKVQDDEALWKKFSENAIKRVNERYNWGLYAEKLIRLSKLYGFWKFSTDMESGGMKAYLDIIYHMLFKPRAQALLERHNGEGIRRD